MNKVKKLPKSPDKKKFHENMNKVLEKLEKKGIELEKLNAVEVFGRGGDWHTVAYVDKVKSLEVWEIDKKFERQLEKNLPKSKIRIIDSINTILRKKLRKKFDLIVIDNPMNVFGKNNVYCEHFNFISQIGNISSHNPIIIFNINRNPFDLEKSPKWKNNREKFYNLKNTSKIEKKFILEFYEKKFRKSGYSTKFRFLVRRHKTLEYCVFSLMKRI